MLSESLLVLMENVDASKKKFVNVNEILVLLEENFYHNEKNCYY
jgi:hypothetical protein